MTLMIIVNDLHFYYQLRVYQDACFMQIWWFEPKSVLSYPANKPNFLEFWVKMGKMTLKVMVNDLHFRNQPKVSQDACLVQIWIIQLNYVMSYHAEKVKFTDRDRQTDRCRQRL